MKLTIKKAVFVEEEVDVQLPLFWKLDNWFCKVEEIVNYFNDFATHNVQLTSVSNNSVSKTLMTIEQFTAYYTYYHKLYEEVTEEEFYLNFNNVNKYIQ